MVLTPLYETVENGWVQAWIKELPEVVTAAPTREQAEGDLRDALQEYVASLADDGLPLPVRVDHADEIVLAS
jgi:predicted RNase H-like HicB family nuclease